jgi:hypothetical protein
MKKWLIGSIVGAILLFVWQFLSWTMLNLHSGEAKYTPAQDSVLQVLSSTLKENGMYFLPTTKPGADMKEDEEIRKNLAGKPFALITYNTSFSEDMAMPMIRGFLICLSLVLLLMYVLTSSGTPTAMRIFVSSLAVGFITWLAGPYLMHNWFQSPIESTTGHLIDGIAGWGIVGLWLAWWLNRK